LALTWSLLLSALLIESASTSESLMATKSSHEVFDVDSTSREAMESTVSSSGHSLRIVLTCHIVHIFSLGVFEELIGIDDFFKFLFGPGVLFVPVGVVLFRSLLEPLLDLLLGGIFGHSEYFVGIGTFGDNLGDKSGECDNEKHQIPDEFHITCELIIYLTINIRLFLL
jgi:hypothetical protein